VQDRAGRQCAACGGALSRYNGTNLCGQCSRSPHLPPAVDLWASAQVRSALTAWDVGTVVSLYRSRTGVTQGRVAAAVGIDQSEVSRLERGGKRRPVRGMLGKAAGSDPDKGCFPAQASSPVPDFLVVKGGQQARGSHAEPVQVDHRQYLRRRDRLAGEPRCGRRRGLALPVSDNRHHDPVRSVQGGALREGQAPAKPAPQVVTRRQARSHLRAEPSRMGERRR
jgi:transcriptional regulator with XRE-family HTH domain